jgi:thioredoxin reductase (NADPH)
MDMIDCLIVGGGPAGLTAALYLARFRRDVLLIDAGQPRAAWIPVSHNIAGFPDGIGGKALLERMRTHAARYGAKLKSGTVDGIGKIEGGFEILAGNEKLLARTVLLATGVINNRPDISDDEHETALANRLLGYCPVCDGFEAQHKRIGVLGNGASGIAEALFLRQFTSDVTLMPTEGVTLDKKDRDDLERMAIVCEELAATSFEWHENSVTVRFAEGAPSKFDMLYAALGTSPNDGLAHALALDLTEQGCIIAGKHQETSIPGVYTAGDVVQGLDQVAVATGQAAIAATAIHNYLRELDGQTQLR